MGELRKIPNVGERTEAELIAMGYPTVASLRGRTGEQLYAEACALRGCTIDRCQLYLYRAVAYFVNSDRPDRSKCKWWHWKDEFVEPAPCGAVCIECPRFPERCAGCRKIEGKVYWLAYAGGDVCKVYDCCVAKKGQTDCGECSLLPCEKFTKDPTISEAENAAHLQAMVARLTRRLDG